MVTPLSGAFVYMSFCVFYVFWGATGLGRYAFVLGMKVQLECTTKDIRAIVPMSSVLRLLDRVLSLKLERLLQHTFKPSPRFFIGAQKFTQALDIGHAAALFIEKAPDNHSTGAWAQSDILTYFDSLPTLLIL